jgi:hypothetical protein
MSDKFNCGEKPEKTIQRSQEYEQNICPRCKHKTLKHKLFGDIICARPDCNYFKEYHP